MWCVIFLLWNLVFVMIFHHFEELSFFFTVAVLRLCHSLQLSTVLIFLFFCILLPSLCSSLHSCLTVALISILWLTCSHIFSIMQIHQLWKTEEKVRLFPFFFLSNPTAVFHNIAAVSHCFSRSFCCLCYTAILLMIISVPVLISYSFLINSHLKIFGLSE